MSSTLRLVFGLMIASLSFFALNATAQTTDTSTQPAAATTQSTDTMTATTPTTKAHHKRSRYKMVDLNSASAQALAKIRGIGKRRAAAIVAYRTKNGSFTSVDDLSKVMNAKGKPAFTSKGLMKLQKHLTVGTASK